MFLQTGDPPWPLVEVYLCRLYRCTPSQLDQEDWLRAAEHLAVVEGEARVRAKVK